MSAITVLGLGAMGHAIAARLMGAGHNLAVWNRTPGKDDALVAAGARRGVSPANAVQEAEVVITMLTDPPALEEVLFGVGAAASAIPRHSTLIEMSTVGPAAIASLRERLGPVRVLDAPVLGSVPSVLEGRLGILVGGERDVFDRHENLLSVLGTPTYVGSSGSGAWLKLVNNAASISALVALGELLSPADRAGLDTDVVLDSLQSGPLASMIDRWRSRLEGEEDASYFRLDLAKKDLELALAEATREGANLTMTRMAAARCDEAIESGLGDQDFGTIVGFLRR